jgi:hypothetical protein
MANFKRKRTKEYTYHYCGYRHCIHDQGKMHGNGRDRYLPMYWKHFVGSRPWRYAHKNVDPREFN